MLVAATYVRASTELQVYSISNQNDALAKYAAEHNLAVLYEYSDDGRSGLDLRRRAGLQRLLSDVVKLPPPFQALLVYDISRWGRFQDIDESAHYEFLCRRAGVDLIYVAEPFDNDGTSISHIMKAIKRTMAAEYSRELSNKVRTGKRRLAKMGYVLSKAPFGLRRLLVDENGMPKEVLQRGQRKNIHSDRIVFAPGPPDEIKTIRLIFQLFVHEGLGYSEIARELQRRGLPSPAGRRWANKTVRTTLENEQYAGTVVYGRTATHLGRNIDEPEDRWIRVEGAHKAIVPKSIFHRAKQRMKEGMWAKTNAHFLLPLKALYEREGYLSPKLINAQVGMPCSQAYRRRFKGITNAYRLVGYVSLHEDRVQRVWAKIGEVERLAMLDQLRLLLDSAGSVTAALIDQTHDMPSAHTYRWTFGTLDEAYALIGYTPRGQGRRRARWSQQHE